jgi:hypothetical protein
MENRYNHQQLELEMQQLWEQKQTYVASNIRLFLLSIDTLLPT